MTKTTTYKCRVNTPVCEPVKEKGDICIHCKWVNRNSASSTHQNKGELIGLINSVGHIRKVRW